MPGPETPGAEVPPPAAGTAMRARAVLDRGAAPEVLEFDAVSISTDDPDHLVVALANAAGHSLTLLLPRRELKQLLNWRMLMSL
jgi:hypothetical protein